MAVVTGFFEVTSGERASQEFDFQGGRCGYMVLDAVPARNTRLGLGIATHWCNVLA